MNENLIEITKQFVKEILQNAEGGHDWQHINRVYKNAMKIAKTENCIHEIVALGALLHDIADSKFNNGNEKIGPKIAADYLHKENVENSTVEHVINIIKYISFKNSKEPQSFKSIELDIVQDADRLDAIGAVGIARAFNYGGFKNRKLYDPNIPPDMYMDKEAYKKSTSPTINHFYEKLLLLKNLMNTATGKQLAEERHQFMEVFLDHFFNEAEETPFEMLQ